MTGVQLILASASPRRRELLAQIGIKYQVAPVDCDESALPDESPEDYVVRVARDKAQTGWKQHRRFYLPVLGADTAVVVDGQILGKPRDYEHARDMLNLLSGRSHRVLSAVAVMQGERQQSICQQSRVTMRAISQEEISAYWGSQEPQDKAGAYAVQGLGAVFIQHLEGSYSGVMGLPLFETAQLLQAFGLPVLK